MTPTVVQHSRSRQFALGAGGGRHRAGTEVLRRQSAVSVGRALHLNDGNNGRPHRATETGEESMSKQQQLQGLGSQD